MFLPLASPQTKSHNGPMGRPARSTADRNTMKLVGIRLRWVREVLGITQQEMADRMGLHQSAWSLYERGLRFPDQFLAIALCGKLQIDFDYMIKGDLKGVGQELATHLAARHPELVEPNGMAPHKGTARA